MTGFKELSNKLTTEKMSSIEKERTECKKIICEALMDKA